MILKICTGCRIEKAVTDFPANRSSPSGLHSRCKLCRKAVKTEYMQRPEVAAREKDRLVKEYADNRDTKSAQRRLRYSADKSAALAKNREWRTAHLEQHRAQCRNWARNNPEKMRAIVATRRAKLRGVAGTYGAKDIAALMATQQAKCNGCKGSLADAGYHVDHIYPLSKGGSNSPENLQLLCPTCNRCKGAKLPHEWQPQVHR